MTGAIHFEVKKHAVRQTADGWVVSFVVHPNDMDSAFAVSPLGTRYMLAVAQIGDDELPVSPASNHQPKPAKGTTVADTDGNLKPQSKPAGGSNNETPRACSVARAETGGLDNPQAAGESPAHSSWREDAPKPAKERRSWDTLSPQVQAGILCSDGGFQKYVRELTGWTADEHSAAVWLRQELGILSRKELEGRPDLAAKLDEIREEFMRWAGRVPVAVR